ncbi:extracellular solute-binding protein [Acuticoccus sediminis]|uniref:extracellular solute-binding protein n=1 Tax=Acuticoccus sediminis TaxID=2184697 RepID=UPI001CFE9482|nr:extracellular solute-binding protein [Acuticoccus sediminis]
MLRHTLNRRTLLRTAAALGASTALPRMGWAADEIVATSYPGSFEEAYRSILLPAFAEKSGADAILTPLLGVDQVAKIAAAKNNPPYDVVIFDEGPLLASLDKDILQPYPETPNLAGLPAEFQGEANGGYGPTVTVQIIVLAYNPKKVPPPTDWLDMWKDDYKGRVGLTGMGSSLGTSYMTEIAKRLGGSETDYEPAFQKMKELLPSVAAIAPSPGALAALFQTGEVDIAPNYFNNVMLLKEKGVDVDYVIPQGAPVLIRTSMHVVKNTKAPELAAQYIDTAIAAAVQQKLLDPPFYFVPTNKDVTFGGEVAKIASDMGDLLEKGILLDWPTIVKTRPQLIERFNEEIRL